MQRRFHRNLGLVVAIACGGCSEADPQTPSPPDFAGPLQGGEPPGVEGQTEGQSPPAGGAPESDVGSSAQEASPESGTPDGLTNSDSEQIDSEQIDGAGLSNGSGDEAPSATEATESGPGAESEPAAQGEPEPAPPDDSSIERGSAGCGRASGIPDATLIANSWTAFPAGYDGSTPFPLVFAFHGAGRTNVEMRTIDSRTVDSALEEGYVVAFMQSAGSGWDVGADYPRFNAALAQIHDELCVDTELLFAFGHSSGAQFIVQMLGDARARESRFTGVVPVASSRYFNPAWPPVPTLVIHGLRDSVRGGDQSGARDVVQYTESNQCTGGSSALGIAGCESFQESLPVAPGCVSFDGCAAPTLFCNHDDPNYQDTNHGWPCFANQQIFEFFESLR